MDIWELLGNYFFVMVMVFYLCHWRSMRILVTSDFCPTCLYILSYELNDICQLLGNSFEFNMAHLYTYTSLNIVINNSNIF